MLDLIVRGVGMLFIVFAAITFTPFRQKSCKHPVHAAVERMDACASRSPFSFTAGGEPSSLLA